MSVEIINLLLSSVILVFLTLNLIKAHADLKEMRKDLEEMKGKRKSKF